MKRLTVFRFLIGLALLCAGALTLYAQASFPEIFVVNSTGEGDDAFPGDGQCETAVGNGVCTLRAAMEEANAHAGGDGIFFSIPTSDSGYSNGVWFIQLFKALPDISDSVNINGPGANKLIVESLGDERFAFRIFNVTASGTVSFSGLTIANGFTSSGQYGAAIQNVNGGTVNITNCILNNNQSHVGSDQYNGGGGAIFNASSGTVN